MRLVYPFANCLLAANVAGSDGFLGRYQAYKKRHGYTAPQSPFKNLPRNRHSADIVSSKHCATARNGRD